MPAARLQPLSWLASTAAAFALLTSVPAPTLAQPAMENEAALERGAVPDTTPRQRYQTAIREAGGGLKVSLQECRSQGPAQRRSCEGEARARYQADMQRARAMLKDPSLRPVNETGGPIRSTETTYTVRP